jgi:hypothetical protein
MGSREGNSLLTQPVGSGSQFSQLGDFRGGLFALSRGKKQSARGIGFEGRTLLLAC